MSSLTADRLFGVRGKVVLITGGSRGIGKMIANGFVSNGAKVYICSRIEKECKAAAKELNALGTGICIALSADLQKLSDVERLVNELSKHEKMLHVLVNNAGATWAEELDTYPDAAFTKILMLNVQRVFTLTQKCLPLLRAAARASEMTGNVPNDPARVINIGSVEGEGVPPRNTYAYSASKAALHHLSRHLAGRLGWDGITSNTIACGPFKSKMMAHTLRTQGDAIKSTRPLQRIGEPEDIVGTVLFLCSRAGAYVNGATIALDGGGLVIGPKPTL
ncbi:Rhamnolipids biosynthesis 3-oxoacyl-[acyl-carrier-protein] reductase [Grifola frondosa]|uniref:Rhamnolipids biosynthesis 3-oxoacyl-[acyl-carrier-protein] reductase n=1 Tax=Grifola frondosa TaxID=5627 RepID=A0A1C7MQ48_GRIFR|nr:Rhamnolipids biosynthesis 3-oxoacyl-[acyl-carrier-protein] reductase [Grifola frondosa]